MPASEPNPWEAPAWVYGPGVPSATARPRPWVVVVVGVLVLAWLGAAVTGFAVLTRHSPRNGAARGQADPGPITVPVALTATAPPGSPTLLTPAMAKAALLAMWPLRQRLVSSRVVATLPAIETGSALTGDRDRMICGCLEAAMSQPVIAYRVYVSRQTTWPAHFVAEVQLGTPQQPFRYYLVLARAAASQPWKVAFVAGVGFDWAESIDDSRNDRAGYTVPVPANALSSAARLPAALAANYQKAKETGAPTVDHPFLNGAWTSAFLTKVVQTPQGGQVNGHGPTLTVHYFTDPADPVTMVPLSRERTLACGVVRQTAVYSAPHNRLVQDAGQTSWPPTLPPGVYRTVTAAGQLQTCFFLLSPTFDSQVIVTGGDIDSEKSYSGTR